MGAGGMFALHMLQRFRTLHDSCHGDLGIVGDFLGSHMLQCVPLLHDSCHGDLGIVGGILGVVGDICEYITTNHHWEWWSEGETPKGAGSRVSARRCRAGREAPK